MNDEMLEDATILGFHALEFILFRNGQPRKVDEFKANDTYTGFSAITGAQELQYAQTICTLLKQRTFQLQVAWEGEKNSSRASIVKAAGLDYTTENGLSFGDIDMLDHAHARKTHRCGLSLFHDAHVGLVGVACSGRNHFCHNSCGGFCTLSPEL